jgi:hypothetical protein
VRVAKKSFVYLHIKLMNHLRTVVFSLAIDVRQVKNKQIHKYLWRTKANISMYMVPQKPNVFVDPNSTSVQKAS